MPIVTMHRATLLNRDLSPTSRLLYASLAASLDEEDHSLGSVAKLLGVDSVAAMQPYIDELSEAGMVDFLEHAGRGRTLRVHSQPVTPDLRVHACVACEDCGKCSCDHTKGLCQICHRIRRIRAESESDIARWQRQLDEGKTYAMGSSATRLHRWDCKSLNSVEKGLDALETSIDHARKAGHLSYVYWPRLPMLYSAEELRMKGTRKRNCAMCGPEPL
ncbi:hypothetical protein ACWGKO_16290 [Streptomyces griseoincarnatus]